MKLKTRSVKEITVQEWDKLVESVYGRVYSLQQQDDCMDRCTIRLTIPDECAGHEASMHDSIPEVVNGKEMGVKFGVWQARDPKKLSGEIKSQWENVLFWERNFYPLLQSVANDLYKRGLIDAGDYAIVVDW